MVRAQFRQKHAELEQRGDTSQLSGNNMNSSYRPEASAGYADERGIGSSGSGKTGYFAEGTREYQSNIFNVEGNTNIQGFTN